MMSCRAALLGAVAIPACSTPHAYAPTVSSPAAVTESEPRPVLRDDLSDVRASLRAPPRFAYDAQSLGVAGQFVSIRLENVTGRVVPIDHLHAAFSATREGVAFACNTHVRAGAGAIEPARLEPGQSVTFERLLDCTMPLPGRYDVRVWIHAADRDESERDRAGIGLFAGSFQVDVTPNGNIPRPVSSRAGLYALMTGASTAPPMPADAWAKGGYEVVVALINASNRAVAVGPSHASLLVFKTGAPLPCAGRQERLAEPETLAPGGVRVTRVPVECAPTEEGHYEIVGRFAVGNAPEEEIGRVGLLVTQSPYFLFTPERLAVPTLPPIQTQ